MVPESIARDSAVIPVGEENGTQRIATSDPSDFETISKLQFLLGRDILLAVAARGGNSCRHRPALRTTVNGVGYVKRGG
jgi:hypothetical protein